MEILVIFGLIVLNGVFAMSEIAIVSSRQIRLQKAADGGDPGARKALQLSAEPTRFLSTIQVGITLIGILAGAFGEASIVRYLEAWFSQNAVLAAYATPLAWTVMVVSITYCSLIFGELVPKRLALMNPERIARVVARPMDWLAQAFRPLVWWLTVSTEIILRLLRVKPLPQESLIEEEIHSLIKQGAESGELEESEQDLVSNVLRLDDKRVGNIMTLKDDMEYLNLHDGNAVSLEKIRHSTHSWLPVCDGSIANVLGMVSSREVLSAGVLDVAPEIRAWVRPALQISIDTTVLQLLEAFKASRAKMAIVLDHQGQTTGLVSMADVMMAIIGDLAADDEDYEPDFIAREDGSWLVCGQTDIASFKHKFSIRTLPDEERGDYHSLGGFIFTFLDRVPREGETFTLHNLRIEIVDMDGNRVDKVLVNVLPQHVSSAEEHSAFRD